LSVSNKIGKKIRQLRALSGLSQDNVADEIGMSNGNFGKIERGEIDIDSTHLISLAKILKVDVGEFFEDKLKTTIKESKPEYGFASKDDVNTLMHTVQLLAKEIEKLREELPKKTLRQTKRISPKKNYGKKS
jgi:transcriptional regulator with XRE-family HTH domain